MTRTKTRAMLLALFGLVFLASMTLAALPTGRAMADTGSNWTGQYWNNNSLTGNPTITRTDNAIQFNWATGSPDPAIPADNFSARWTLTTNFNAGFYRFRAGADDGFRVFIDNITIMDKWSGFPGLGFGEASVDVNLGAGQHTLRVEYVERTGNAGVLFEWTGSGTSSGPTATSNGLVTATFGAPTSAVTTPTCEIIIDFANIRPDPSTNNPPLGQARLGQRYKLIGTDSSGTWYQVDLGNGQKGWFYRRVIYLFPGSTDNLPVTETSVSTPGPIEPATGTAVTGLILRSEPSRRADKVGAVNEGESFQIIAWSSSNRAWVQVKLSNGQTGWAFIPYIIITSGNLNRLPRHD